MSMLNTLYPVIRPVLFSMDAERAHELTLDLLSRAPRLAGWAASSKTTEPPSTLRRTVAGLPFGGPVGLAAGLDKNGVAVSFWPTLGFGFIEIGTVTAHPQTGNPRPRLFRLVEDEALINRMGFNNHGSQALATRLEQLKRQSCWPDIPVGVNIGKSKITPLREAPEDYGTSTRRLLGLADYFTINVSSPNTPGLRTLQQRDHLEGILDAVLHRADGTPVFLKLAPDLEADAFAEAIELAIDRGISGIVATNTTIRRDGLTRDPGESGGLSGRPLRPLAEEMIRHALEVASGRVPVIGVGGISTPDDVDDLLGSGCAAVQLYSALIYRGPGLIHRMNQVLAEREGHVTP